MSAVLNIRPGVSAQEKALVMGSMGWTEHALAAHERDVDRAEALEAHKQQAEDAVHAELRAQVLGLLASGDLRGLVPFAELIGMADRARYQETAAQAFDLIIEVIEQPRVFALLCQLMMTPAASQFRQAVADASAELNAAGLAEARNWGLVCA